MNLTTKDARRQINSHHHKYIMVMAEKLGQLLLSLEAQKPEIASSLWIQFRCKRLTSSQFATGTGL